MVKQITFADEARKELVLGVQKLTDAVKVTMGPRGRNVLIQKGNNKPYITKDGVSVAQEVFLKNPIQNSAAQLVKEVSGNVAYEAGDGTTTATVLTNAIFKEGVRAVTAGEDPVTLKREMDKVVNEVLVTLKENSRECKTKEEITQVATISANSDINIGNLISEAIESVGIDGTVTVEANTGTVDELTVVEGMQLDGGYMSPHFINNKEKGICEIENPHILVMDMSVTNLSEILHIMEETQASGKPLVIFCEDFESEPLATLVVNKLRGIIDVYPIKVAGFGETKTNLLEDIAISTGSTLASNETGYNLASLSLADLGSATKISIDKDSSIIMSNSSSKQKVQERVDLIKTQIEQTDPGYAQDKLKLRLGRLVGGVAVIKVGAQTEVEMEEKRDRVDDALGATRAAIEEGIVIGGGCALLNASNKLSTDTVGSRIIREALLAPFFQISENAGFNPAVNMRDLTKVEPEIGFNASSGVIENLFESGVIDPLKVTRLALVNANSVASMLLTTECTINDMKED